MARCTQLDAPWSSFFSSTDADAAKEVYLWNMAEKCFCIDHSVLSKYPSGNESAKGEMSP
jgi:hypothetical protein